MPDAFPDRPVPNPLTRLTESEAAQLLAEHGPNELPAPKQPSVRARAMRQLADPLSILLLTAGLVSYWCSDDQAPARWHGAPDRRGRRR
ncbi:cation-transporting P-type ATPase [Nonomuraea aurantiaca]|uniref:cation-transporting P-type ATPase n=1 Tax=Nonomuraea aurantiaca TaxID=2878562 RepID=UPI001CD9E012|nr:cation-transporting P-type ATPase [Nonomuraea aurantiaca]MCA2229272.1 hypothetical protein [Nonomuraea aurantiaca]